MKRYKSHKIVEAGLIARFEGLDIVLANGERVRVNSEDHARIGNMRHDREGYLVRYEDGYLSWSPKKAFDEGYTEVT